MRKTKLAPLPKLDEDIKTTLDLRGSQKVVSIYCLGQLVNALASLQPGDAIDLSTDSFEGLRNDILAWGRLTGHSVREICSPESSGEEEKYDRYVVVKRSDEAPGKTKGKVAIIISQDGLLELASPLGFALGSVIAGMEVALFFQGPGVRILRKGFRAKMPGCLAAPFSRFARNGMASVGHDPPENKLEQLHKFGAKFYVCHPSLDHFGVDFHDMAFNDVVLAEYVTFLEQMCDATVKLYP